MTRSDALRVAWHWLRPSSLLAMALGALLAVPLTFYGDDWLSALDYWARPIAKARAAEVHREGDEIHFKMYVTRLRGECRVLGAYAYAVTPERFPLRAYAARIDGDGPRDMPVGVEIDSGEWRAWPIAGAKTLVIYVHHGCGDKLISTKLVEVPT